MHVDAKGIRALILMGVVVILLFALGFGVLALAAPAGYHLADGSLFGWGTGLLALLLGVRHAFDADHIAAIDNTTRKLAADGKPALDTGFFFSLGHSTIVFAMAIVLGLGVAAINSAVTDDGSTLQDVTGIIGTSVSGIFLILIAVLNILVTASIVRVFRRMRAGEYDESAFEEELRKRGLMNRIFGRLGDRIDKSWKLYPLGVLFGLGFDTATEITLLVLSGSAVVSGLPWWAILALPLLFAAGMCLFDTIDGVLMNVAYGWAFIRPARKVYYNVVVTVVSVVIALGIGLLELGSLLAEQLGWDGPFWSWLAGIDLEYAGYAIVGLLLVTWIVAVVVWRVGRFEQRYELPTAAPAE